MDHSRREVIRGGLQGGAAALAGHAALASPAALAASRPSSTGVAKLFAQASSDADVLRGLITVEQLLVFSYEHLLSAGGLSESTKPLISSFLAQERAHLTLLTAALKRRGETAPSPPSTVAEASRELAQLGAPGSLRLSHAEVDSVHYLIGAETVTEGAYYGAMSKLADAKLAVTAAEIMACQAQHWSSLSGLLHAGDVNRAVPYPVVLG